MPQTESIIGCLLGTAVGDALGLPYEGLSRQRIRKIAPKIDGHRFIFGKGMVSDDTEHTCMVAQSLIVSGGEEKQFTQSLSWRLKFWLLGLPAGIGFATLRGIVKLWIGFPAHCSGVFSAGNGAAMRSAIIGVCYGRVPGKLSELVKISTRLTHRDPKAEYGAMAVAIAAYLASTQQLVSPGTYYQTLVSFLPTAADSLLVLIRQACDSAYREETGEEFALSLGLGKGITGYVYHTVPVVIQVWLTNQQDYQEAVAAIIQLGGDTDTTAAILGGIMGAAVGKTGIPQQWLKDLWPYPRSVNWIEALGQRLAVVTENGAVKSALSLPVYAIIAGNLLFLVVVLFHGFRRLFPPY